MARGWKVFLVVALGLLIVSLPLSSTTAPAAAVEEHRHPHLLKAIEELREAKEELEETDHDYGGHKKEAVEAIRVALRQLKLCREHEEREKGDKEKGDRDRSN